MAESQSSTSEKPPIQKLGLGLLLPDSTPSDPINPASQIVEIQHPENSENAPIRDSDSPTKVMVDETINHDEDAELRNAIEKDLYKLTIEQAEIERARSGGVEGDDLVTMRQGDGVDLGTVRKGDEDEVNDLGAVRNGDEHEENNLGTVGDGDGGEGNDLGTVTKGDGDEGNDLGIVMEGGEVEEKDGKELGSVGDDNENDGADGENVASKYGDGMTNFERGNQSNNRRRSNYPMRPDAEDCTFYMKFGSCKFGLNCKFNHPPRRKNQGVKERANHREENPERAGQTECKYYLTSGGCKYGKDCKYSHGSDKSATPQVPEFNFLGLPIRMETAMNRGRGRNRGGGGDGRQFASRGRSSRFADHYVPRRVSVDSGARSAGASSGNGLSEGGSRNPETTSIDDVTKEFDLLSSSDFPHGLSSRPRVAQGATEAELTTPLNVTSASPCYENYSPLSSTPSEQNAGGPKIIESYFSSTPHVSHKKKEPSQSTGGQFHKGVQSEKTKSEGTSVRNELENFDSPNKGFSFDICEERNKSIPKLKTSLRVKNKATRVEKKHQDQGDNIQVVRPGMILLKGYVSITDQVKMIKSCRVLGRGPGGFYQPGYRNGARLHLKMMCLGKNWDPDTSFYNEIRPIDQAKPPPIPDEFQQLVQGVIQKCHTYLESDSKLRNAKNSIPSMSPNICIVNFYSQTGKRGLHQDKDESQESLRKGLPVVSVSLGDSAEFLYGDQRDIDKADKIVLESGDVLVFGGESRHIFHGVSSIKPGTASSRLLEETDLRPGRLNLTFREY